MTETSKGIREQDLEDLMERWHDTIRDLKTTGSEESAQRSGEAFNAILEYLYAGEVPEVSGPDRTLYKVERVGGGTL